VLGRLRRWLASQGLIWFLGLAVIGVGIVCLYLSDAVVQGWWQGTLDAFGVGFVVGGLIDVLAISGLNQALVEGQKRREINFQAEQILRGVPHLTGADDAAAPDPELEAEAEAARKLLIQSGDQIVPQLRAELQMLVDNPYGYASYRGRPPVV
jgi:hypothetical protein